MLLQEVDKNASTVIRRREELYFTRTNLLKETLRLRSEIERLPTHSLPASSRYQPVPSPPTGQRPSSGRGSGGSSSPRRKAAQANLDRAGGNGAGNAAVAAPIAVGIGFGGQRAAAATAQLALLSAQSQPTTFVHGLSPRSPRSVDNQRTFGELIENEAKRAKQLLRPQSATALE